nr:zinc finger matrin-type protein 2 isoform X2 [Setaria viridis]
MAADRRRRKRSSPEASLGFLRVRVGAFIGSGRVVEEYLGRLLFWAREPLWAGQLGCSILCKVSDAHSSSRSPRLSRVHLSPVSPLSWPSSSRRLLGERRSPSPGPSPATSIHQAVCSELTKMSGNQPVGVDNTSRRKFDKEEYLERARQREQREKDEARKGKERGPLVQRQPLKHRDYEVDLESRLGKTQVVTPIAPLNQQAGYYCSVCECVVKDSANYLDHINGKKHQRALGMSMRVERASLEQVQKRFEALKKRKDPSTFTEQDLDERIMKQQQEEEERKRQRKEKKKEKKREQAAQHEPEDVDPDIAAMMGFGGFGSSKK